MSGCVPSIAENKRGDDGKRWSDEYDFLFEQRADGNVAATNIEGGAFHAGSTPNQQTTAGTAIDTTSEHHAHSNHPGGVNAAFGDAHVSFYSNDVSTTHWQGLSTANGGENEFAGSE